ncbi:helix-turn-helix domain-containing protein [Microbacterium sp. RD1]|uniref:helix-turn-helix domain-containing protein n=1 Tax=Microbacterium sp. RD1 TaxID=3457313 RepID=UPI003FA5B2C9
MTTLSLRIGAALRREREAHALSVSELARQAGVSKATVSQLESGGGNPSVETLWALATAMDIPFSTFVDDGAHAPTLVRAADGGGIRSASAPYLATLLSASPHRARRDIYLITAEPGEPRRSAPHSPGTIEHVILASGAARVGPAGEPFTLSPGDYLSYPGDAPHVFEALVPGTRAVLISESR